MTSKYTPSGLFSRARCAASLASRTARVCPRAGRQRRPDNDNDNDGEPTDLDPLSLLSRLAASFPAVWAMVWIPCASPLTTIAPRVASTFTRRRARRSPSAEGRRVPTTATRGCRCSNEASPATQSTGGTYLCSTALSGPSKSTACAASMTRFYQDIRTDRASEVISFRMTTLSIRAWGEGFTVRCRCRGSRAGSFAPGCAAREPP